MKLVRESLEFERGRDPKDAMGIGSWRDGYKIDKEPEYPPPDDGYVRIDFKGDEWNWRKKAFDPSDMRESEVTPDMQEKLEGLPVVTFKNYYESGNITGLFGDWPEDFPYIRTPFLANVLEDEGRTFLIEQEGYYYPRYMTELV